MPSHQNIFLAKFKSAFVVRFGDEHIWQGGQRTGNYASLQKIPALRRNGKCRSDERFELGDLRLDFNSKTIIVEYESWGVSTHNLLKYWPYIIGDLDMQPCFPVILCHFSNWGSWASYRDTWVWLSKRMENDPARKVDFVGRQFDHGPELLDSDIAIQNALDWISTTLAMN